MQVNGEEFPSIPDKQASNGKKMAQNIPTSSFYSRRTIRIRITCHGIVQEQTDIGIVVLDALDSDVEDDEDDEQEQSVNKDACENNDDDDDDDVDYKVDDYDVDDDRDDNDWNSTPCNAVNISATGRSTAACRKIQTQRWRRREPAKVNSVFSRKPLPSPPKEILTPMEYFKQFFDDQLINHISEQTNLYSVQTNRSTVATTANEIEQYIGVLLFRALTRFLSTECTGQKK